ncbi:MAG TPA: cold-shock protein [Bacillota bacterium]|nr:cold-shock protein [Bacillota bacterium]
MSFSRSRKEPISEVETSVWACIGDNCNGWMRASYSFEEEPKCPLCQSSMKQEIRMLPELK